MRYLILFVLLTGLQFSSFAQKTVAIHASKSLNASNDFANLDANTGLTVSHRTTAPGDTVYMTHIGDADTISLYYLSNDSGFVAGMDAYGDKAFAERYDFASTDSTVRIIGVIARFGGSVSPLSTKSVTFNVWNPGQPSSTYRPTLFNSGLPSSVITSYTVKMSDLGVATVDTAFDTAKVFLFTTPTPFLSQSFFVGYNVNYTWGSALAGDTVGLYSNKGGERTAPSYTVVSVDDTMVNNLNVTKYADNIWHDNVVDNFHLSNNLYVFPIVIVGAAPAHASGINRGSFTLYNCYPNPADNSSNIKIGLAKNTDVSVDIMDVRGNVVQRIKQDNLAPGEHIITISTAGLAAGDYVYMIRTGLGDGIAGKMTVTK
jgi:hypothetical protein